MTKLDDERYWVVASDTVHRHVADLDEARTFGDAHAFVADMTGGVRRSSTSRARARAS